MSKWHFFRTADGDALICEVCLLLLKHNCKKDQVKLLAISHQEKAWIFSICIRCIGLIYIGPTIIIFGLENEKHKILVIIECVVEQIVQAFLEQ